MFELTFPDGNNMPAQLPQLRLDLGISCHIGIELLEPEFFPAFWCVSEATGLMSVPEAPVDKNDGFVLPEYDVGSPWQIGYKQSKPISHAVQHGTHSSFRPRISPPNTGHHYRAFGLGENVGHSAFKFLLGHPLVSRDESLKDPTS